MLVTSSKKTAILTTYKSHVFESKHPCCVVVKVVPLQIPAARPHPCWVGTLTRHLRATSVWGDTIPPHCRLRPQRPGTGFSCPSLVVPPLLRIQFQWVRVSTQCVNLPKPCRMITAVTALVGVRLSVICTDQYRCARYLNLKYTCCFGYVQRLTHVLDAVNCLLCCIVCRPKSVSHAAVCMAMVVCRCVHGYGSYAGV